MDSPLFWLMFSLYASLCLCLWLMGSTPIYRAGEFSDPDQGGIEHPNPTA